MLHAPSDPDADRLAPLPGMLLPAVLAGGVLLLAAMLSRVRLAVDVQDRADRLLAAAALALVAGLVAFRAPRARWQRAVRDGCEYVGLFGGFCLVGVIASYPLAAATRSFADPGLEAADRLLRFDWLAWYDLVVAHPALQRLGGIAYQSIFVTPAALLGYFAWTGRRAQARLFIASFALAALLTLALFPLLPAEGPLAYLWHGPVPYLPASARYQAELIPLLRRGAVHVIGLASLHGLVCAPSFHAASALLYILAAWPERRLRWPVLTLNAAMLLSTPVEGTHYLIDMLLGAAVAVLARRTLAECLRRPQATPARSAAATPWRGAAPVSAD